MAALALVVPWARRAAGVRRSAGVLGHAALEVGVPVVVAGALLGWGRLRGVAHTAVRQAAFTGARAAVLEL